MKLNRSFILFVIFITLLSATPIAQAKSDNANKKSVSAYESEDEYEDESQEDEEDEEDDIEIKPGKSLENKGTINQNTLKVEVKNQGKSTKIKTTTNWGSETETELESETEDEDSEDGEQEVVEVESENPQKSFKIKVKTKEQTSSITQSKFAAKTHYPLTINSETNELIVSTPAGTKVVTVLPDSAIANMLRRGVVDVVASSSAKPKPDDNDDQVDSTGSAQPGDSDNTGTPSGDLDLGPVDPESFSQPTDENPIVLTTQEDQLVYKVKGSKKKRFLGIIPVNIDKTVTVSAEDGEVIDEEINTLGDRFLNALSL